MPTTLATGDLAIVGASADTKSFAFVLLVDVDAGTQINFTDNGWLAAGGFRAGEGGVTWTASGTVTAGTVIVFTAVGANGFTASGGAFNNATAGDQIIAYQGAASASTQPIYALDYADSNATFAANATNSNNSALPAGLSLGATANALGDENLSYVGPTSGTREFLLTEIGKASNWTTSDDVAPTYPTAFLIGGATVTITALDADNPEGNSGHTDFTFTVTRSDGTGSATVDWNVTGLGGSGQAAADDFAATSGSVSFAAGETSKTVTLQVMGDTAVEGDETFGVTLANPGGGYAVSGPAASGVIRNDDAAVVTGTPWINEFHYDNAGGDTGEFIEIAGPAGLNLTGYSVVLYNGNGGGTYNTIALSGTIPAGQNGSGVIVVNLPANGLQNGGTTGAPEPDGIALVGPGDQVLEFVSYEGVITATGGVAAGMTSTDVGVFETGSANGTSIARTGAGGEGADFAWSLSTATPNAVNGGQVFETPTARVRITDATVTEGDSGDQLLTFTVTRSGPAQAFTVDYATADGTASAGSDYVATSGTLAFDAGQMSKTVSVVVHGDTTIELSETLFLNLANPTGGATLGDAQGLGRIVNDDLPNLKIYEIQGAGHVSAYDGQDVVTQGVVTAIDTTGGGRGFWIQDPNGDGDDATSDGIFVVVGAGGTLDVAVGDLVRVRGTVDEFGSGNNLTITEIVAPTVTKIGTGTVDATVLGVDRTAPTAFVGDDDDVFDPSSQAMDFYESLEGMLVTAPDARAADLSDGGATWVVPNGGAGATGVNDRGGVTIAEGDFNPERIQVFVDSGVLPGVASSYDMGDRLGDVTGVVHYFGGNYELVATSIANPIDPGSPPDDVTALVGDATHLTMAAYNLENLDPNDTAEKFNGLAQDIVGNLKSPDIIGVEEIQDADGKLHGSDMSGALTAQKLIDAIVAAGGPRYVYVEVAPTPDTSGGEDFGNIRTGFLYNPARVSYVDGSARQVDPTDPAYDGSRKPLAADFVFRGETITAIDMHSTSRIGSDEGIYGDRQPPLNAGEAQRIAQSQAVHDFVLDLQAAHPGQHVAVMGDFNGFQFEDSLTVLEQGGSLTNLTWLLPAEERYSYVFDGNSQQIDHMLVSDRLYASAQFDIVHLNSGKAGPRPTDHDPVLGRFLVNTAPVAVHDTAQVFENQTVTIDVLANDTDLNTAETRTIVSVAGEGLGGVAIVDGKLVYAADADVFDLLGAGQTATETLTYVMRDAAGATSTATVQVTISGVANGATQLAGNGADLVQGTAADELLDGGNGADRVFGLAGADTLLGGNGADQLFGGAGIDSLSGGNGADLLDGGAGADWLEGGNGADRFVFTGAFGRDVLADFGNGDVLQFDRARVSGFADLMAHAHQQGDDVVIAWDAQTSVVLQDVSLASLRAGDFLFV